MFAQYGVGRGLYTGDTTIGLKGRIVFEAPGLAALLVAHRALEEAVLSKQQNRFKPDVARKWVEIVYEGFFHDPLKTDLEAVLASSQRMVNGEVVLETRGGRVDAVAVRSPHILNASGATYAQSADWGVEEAEGFIKLFGMSSTLWAQVNKDQLS
jgi:argininosuccinate synthase